MRSCRTVHLRAPRALWRRPLSADSPSVTTYAGSSNAPNQAASRCVGSCGHDRPPSRSWQVPARRTSHRRAGALRWIDVATEKAPTDRGLKVTTKGEAPSPSLAGGSENSRCALSALPSIHWDLERGASRQFFGKSSHHASRPCGYVCPVPSAETSR
jgi:hypothetical protein